MIKNPTPDTEVSYAQAAYLGLRDAMRADPRVTLFGECVSEGGPFGSAAGLLGEFGTERVVDTPAAGAVASAIEAATRGAYPVVDVSLQRLLTSGLDLLVEYVARFSRHGDGPAGMPLAIRTQLGGVDRSEAGQHYGLEACLQHLSGLRVAVPALPSDAYRLLRSAIRHDYPTAIVEDPTLYERRGLFRPPGHAAAGKAKVMRAGRDATVIATSRMMFESLEATDELAGQGIELEVIDPRWLMPLDLETILDSVRRTRHAVIAHESDSSGGFAAELAALIQEQAFGELAAPVLRVSAGAQVGSASFRQRLREYVRNWQGRLMHG